VILRGLNVTAFGVSCETDGIFIQPATAVYIEDCGVIENFPQKDIIDVRTTARSV
jgi:hypothetical protein